MQRRAIHEVDSGTLEVDDDDDYDDDDDGDDVDDDDEVDDDDPNEEDGEICRRELFMRWIVGSLRTIQ